jgi:hypothetical protein
VGAQIFSRGGANFNLIDDAKIQRIQMQNKAFFSFISDLFEMLK